ncbi:hypothetical protein NW762_005590 [Fusarium torreyae]|uniref:Integral membrane protein n=1 Tax=Fusarium torreyae TaxID=1237075 RepID=A0A9W8S5G1_9HYPO|nr:hypothetical protein NW762_005590 [Fusarium torreyae]
MASNPPYQTYQPSPPGHPGSQIPQPPQVQYPHQQYPSPPSQSFPPGQQPNYQAPTYGYAGPPTIPAQQQPQQHPASSAQFAPPPSAQAALQSSAQSLYKTGKGLLGNLASSIKSKYPATPNTPANTTSYTGSPPKPNYNPAQHPTQSPLSPSQLSHVPSFPQVYGQPQVQSNYPHYQPATPAQQTISPTTAAYPPAPYNATQIASPGYSPSVPGQPNQPGIDPALSAYQQLQSPQENGLTSPPGATPQLPVQSPPGAISPYSQPQLHHQQSNPYQPTPPPQGQSHPHAAAHVGSPSHGQGPPQMLPPHQHYQSPIPQHHQPPYQQQVGLINPYDQTVSPPASQSFAQPAAHVALPTHGLPESHQAPHQQTGLTSPYEPTTSPLVSQPSPHSATSPTYVQSPHQVHSTQQHHQSAVPPPHPQPLYSQPPGPINPHDPVDQAVSSPPPSQQAHYSVAYNDPASHAQSPPPAPPLQQHHSPVLQQPASSTPISQSTNVIQPGPPVHDGKHYSPSLEQAPQPAGAPVIPQLTPTSTWNHNPPPPGHNHQTNGINSGQPSAAHQFQAYSPATVQQDPQAQYAQPPQPAADATDAQYHPPPPPHPPHTEHSDVVSSSQAPTSFPAVAAAGQNFQPYHPSPQPTPYQPGPTTDNHAPSQQDSNGYHQDLLASLSVQMNNLNVQNGNQYPAPSMSGPAVSQDGPRGPPTCQASGAPCDILPYCPEDRSVGYSLDWYRSTDVPKYLICTRCYADHVANTHLAGHFERFHQPDGTQSTCGFWSPRAREIIWPQALQTSDIGPLRTFMEKSLNVPSCKGRVWSTGADGIKWYGMANNEIEGLISCEACYEDRIVGTIFESRFSPYRQQGQDEKWMCDLCIPYLAIAAVKMSKQNNWNGFVEAAKVRIHLPACEGKDVESNNGQWFVPRRKIKDMAICEACYLDKLALTKFGHEFERHQQAQGFDAYMETLGQRWICDLNDTAVNMSIALEAAIYRRDFDIFWNAANAISALVPCTANGIIRGTWWTVTGGCPDVSVCEACYKGILETSGIEKFFEPAQRDATIDVVCTFCPATPRWGMFITKFAEALDKGVFSYFTDYVKKWAGVPTCPGIKNKDKSKWWGHPEALACQDCYLNFLADTSLGQSVPVVGVYDERPLICQFWSPRMRNMWLAACAAGPPESPESQKALDEFRAFGARRVQVYNATIPHIEMIERMMMMKRQQALQQGQLSLMYQSMDGRASLMGTTDGHWHGNSSIGYYETEHGVTAANMMNNMHAGMAEGNKMSDWMQMAQLKSAWMEVE